MKDEDVRVSTTLFLDTMIFLHFKPITDIPWEDLVPDRPLRIGIALRVIRELDAHKNTHKSKTIQGRARAGLRRIEEWEKNPQDAVVRKNITVRVHSDASTQEVLDRSLDPSVADDVLITTALVFEKAAPGSRALLVSDDTGARVKARRAGLGALALQDEHRLPTERDPLEVENERLRSENVRLSALPVAQLKVEFADGHRFAQFSRPIACDHVKIIAERDRRMLELRQKYAHSAEAPLLATAMGVSQEETDRYNSELPRFFAEFDKYLQAVEAFEARRACMFTFELWVENVGRAPAEDIRIRIHFPDGCDVVVADELLGPPNPPKPPVRPRTAIELAVSMIGQVGFPPGLVGSGIGVLQGLGPEPNVSPTRIEEADSHNALWHVGYVKHRDKEKLDTLAIVFDSIESIHSFEATVSADAANVPDETTGVLSFAFEESIEPGR